MGIDGALVRFGEHSPYFVHKLLTGKDFAWIGQQLVQQIKFLLRQNSFFSVESHRKRIVIKSGFSHGYLFSLDIFARLRSASTRSTSSLTLTGFII